MVTLRIEERGVVCAVTLSAPGGNRINAQMVRDLEDLCAYLEDDSPAGVVVFRGEGGVLTRGIDLGDFSPLKPPDIHGFQKWERALAGIERLKKATIAVVEGDCAGGGVQLALACDLRIAGQDSTLALDEVKRGFLPGLATYRLAKYVGLGVARDLLMTGRAIGAQEARARGLVDRVAADVDAEIDRTVMQLVPVNGHVVALARRLLNESYPKDHEDFLGGFLAAQHKAISTEPFIRVLQEGLQQRRP